MGTARYSNVRFRSIYHHFLPLPSHRCPTRSPGPHASRLRSTPASHWSSNLRTFTGICCANLAPRFGSTLFLAAAPHGTLSPRPRHLCPAFVRSSSISMAVPVSERVPRTARPNRVDCVAGIPNDRLLVYLLGINRQEIDVVCHSSPLLFLRGGQSASATPFSPTSVEARRPDLRPLRITVPSLYITFIVPISCEMLVTCTVGGNLKRVRICEQFPTESSQLRAYMRPRTL